MNRKRSIQNRMLGLAFATTGIVALAPLHVVDASPKPTQPSISSSRPGCKPVTFATSVTRTLEAADAALPSLDFACSVHVGIKNSGVAVAISVLGRKLNPKVARYVITANRVGGGSAMSTVAVQPPAQVLRRQLRPLNDGTWAVTIAAFARNGTSMGTWTSAPFVID